MPKVKMGDSKKKCNFIKGMTESKLRELVVRPFCLVL